MSTANKLALLAQTKEVQRTKLGLSMSVPFSEYVNHIAEWSPQSLFAGVEQGLWYDSPSPSTLYQNAVGTTLTNAQGDPTGLRLDRSRGLAPIALDLPTANISSPISLTANAVFSLLATAYTPKGLLQIEIDISGDFSFLSLVVDGNGLPLGTITAAGKRTFTVNNLTPTSSAYASLYIRANTAAQTFMINSFVVKKIYGNHAIQSVSASRPTYQTDGTKSWLYHDKVDDKMSVILPAMTATTVVATDDGVAINYPVAITAGAHQLTNNSTLGRDYGRLIVDRALTVDEQAKITQYFNAKRGA